MAAELRASKPEPSARFVKQLAARINPRPAQPVRTRTRLGLPAAVTATMVAVVGATGGFSSAASTIAGATHSVAHIAHISSTPSALVKNAAAPRTHTGGPTSADSQYAEVPTVSAFSPDNGPAGLTVTVSGTHFSGASQVSSVSLGDSPASPTVLSDSTLTFQVPAGATSGDITVSNAAGSASSTDSFTVIQTPQFGDTPYSPGEAGVGTAITLSGTHFTGVNSVTIGGKAAPIDSISDTEIDTEVPAGAKAGTGSITIKNAAGSASASGFIVDSGAPTVTSFSPGSGASGDSIKISGTNLLTGDTPADVMFNGAADPATLTDGKTPTKTALYVNVPDDAETGAITVTNDIGSGTSKTSFVVLGTPNISDVKPAFGIKNTPVVITGDTFTGAKSVTFQSSGQPDVTVNLASSNIKGDTQITVKAPATLVQGATYTVEVTGKTLDTSDPAGSFYFEAKPAIDSLDPATGGTGQSVAITPAGGNTFLGVTKVTFNGKTATITSNTPTEVDVLVPAGLNTSDTPKNVPVVVSNAAGASVASTFSALNSAPTIKAFTPGAANVGDTLTITGTHLNNSDTTVTFLGGDSCTVANGDLTKGTTGTGSKAIDSVSFAIPDCAATGGLEVDNADGSATSKSFTVYQQPVILGIKPAYGSSKTTTKVTVQGAPGTFAGAYEVDFDAHAVTKGISVAKDSSSLTVTAPKLTAGTYKVTVKVNKAEPLVGDSGNTGLTILDAPTVTGFGDSDTGGMAGDTLTVKGTNFLGVQSVTFGSVKAVFQAVVSGGAIDSTQLTVTIPAGATSNKVTVTTAGGKATSSAAYPILAITKTSPASAKHAKTKQVITITGSGFKFGGSFAAITFGGETIVPNSGSSDTKLLLTVPTDLPAGSQSITITNDLGEVDTSVTLT